MLKNKTGISPDFILEREQFDLKKCLHLEAERIHLECFRSKENKIYH